MYEWKRDEVGWYVEGMDCEGAPYDLAIVRQIGGSAFQAEAELEGRWWLLGVYSDEEAAKNAAVGALKSVAK